MFGKTATEVMCVTGLLENDHYSVRAESHRMIYKSIVSVKEKKGTKWVIDFNKAYNPYCAYSDNYSCPVVPLANHLTVAIEAGIKGGY